jgi:hypothetical protein
LDFINNKKGISMDPITRRLVETIKKITEDTITTTRSSTPPVSLAPQKPLDLKQEAEALKKTKFPDWMKDQANTGRLLKLKDKITDPTGLQNAMDDYVISAQDAVDKQAESAPKPNPVPVPPPPSPFA